MSGTTSTFDLTMFGGTVAGNIADKFRRALRNGTGCRLTYDECLYLAHCGALELILKLEIAGLIEGARDRRPIPKLTFNPAQQSSSIEKAQLTARRLRSQSGKGAKS